MEKIEGKKRLLDTHTKIKQTLMQICKECNLSFEDEYSDLNVTFTEESKESEIRKSTDKMENIIRELIENYFFDRWKLIVNASFTPEQKASMLSLMNALLERDPTNLYLTFSDNCSILLGLCDDELKNKTLKFLEDYSSKKSIEDVTNYYGILFYSVFKDPVTDAFIKGFKHNNFVKDEYVTAYFNGSQLGE